METETVVCPKGCGQSFPVSKMHNHQNECKGQPSYIWPSKTQSTSIPEQVQSQTLFPNQPQIESPKETLIKTETIKPSFCKTCGSSIIETDSFRCCAKCKWIKVKGRYVGFFVLRYSMLIFWLGAGVGFILFAWGYHVYGKGIIP